MTITYPIDFPTDIGLVESVLRARSVVSVSTSPFTLSQQAYSWGGQRWEIECVLPRLDRQLAEIFHSFLLKLKGQRGTFTMYVPSAKNPRATYSSPATGHIQTESGLSITTEGGDHIIYEYGDIVVSGNDQTGDTLTISGYTPNTSNAVLAGDYFQLGTGLNTRLYKALNSADSDAGGNVTLDIFPSLRTSPSNGDVVIWDNPKGLFRLNDNITDAQSDLMNTFYMSFTAVEAL